jgi:microcystin-dependent protein
VPVHMGLGHTLGERAGEESHVVTKAEMPTHIHVASASSSAGDVAVPSTDHVLASPLNQSYADPGAATSFDPASVSTTGSSQPHTNLQPYAVFTFCIALQGIFPSQN